MKQATIQFLREHAARECWSDDDEYNAMEYSGGNYDDAYFGGKCDGMAIMARILLAEIDGTQTDSPSALESSANNEVVSK